MKQKTSDGSQSLAFFYPVMCYYIVVAVANRILASVSQMDAVRAQAFVTAAGGVVLYVCFYVRAGRAREIFTPVKQETLCGGVIAVLMLGGAGIVLNNVISLAGLAAHSQGYQQVEQVFYSSTPAWELLAFGLIAPVTEEFLYRGLVFRRLRESYGRTTAIAGSALIFGVLHMNLVQAVYAALLGLLLAVLMERYDDVRIPMLGHIAANVIAVLRAETDIFSWLEHGGVLFAPVTLALAAVTLYLCGYCVKGIRKSA